MSTFFTTPDSSLLALADVPVWLDALRLPDDLSDELVLADDWLDGLVLADDDLSDELVLDDGLVLADDDLSDELVLDDGLVLADDDLSDELVLADDWLDGLVVDDDWLDGLVVADDWLEGLDLSDVLAVDDWLDEVCAAAVVTPNNAAAATPMRNVFIFSPPLGIDQRTKCGGPAKSVADRSRRPRGAPAAPA
ncbi:MAG: hypothetical protein ACJ79H_11230 [Myxococcales bacterium]